MADRIQMRRDTKARWEQYNPVLLEGEMGIVTDDPNLYKIGNGITAWNNLPYRGFNGTVTSKITNEENTVPSNKAVKNVANAIFNQCIESDFIDTLETMNITFNTGLITRTGNIDESQTNFQCTDYINIERLKDYFIDSSEGLFLNDYYSSIVYYDSDKNIIFNAISIIGYYAGITKINKIQNAKFFRVNGRKDSFVIKRQNHYQTKDFQEKIENKIEAIPNINTAITKLLDENNLVGEYTKHKRIETTLTEIDDYSYAYLKVTIPSDKKYIHFRCTGSQNVRDYFFIKYNNEGNRVLLSYGENNNGFSPELKYFFMRIPKEATELYLNTRFHNEFGGSNAMDDDAILKKYLAASFETAEIENPFIINSRLEKLENITDKTQFAHNLWKDKNIVWFGTSIPSPTYPLGNSYPDEVGRLLYANMHNEAVGSSRASKRPDSELRNTSFDRASTAMGNTLSELIDVLEDIWTIDWVNHTWSNGPRTRNITDIPAPTEWWALAQYARSFIENSYQVKLVLRYLIKNKLDRSIYIHNILETDDRYIKYYSNNEYLKPYYEYQGDMDLFVFDHSNNDVVSETENSDIETTDMNTYAGAMNTYLNLISMYKPRTRVCLVSNYTSRGTNGIGRLNLLKELAHSWQYPFIDLTKSLPFGTHTQYTQGYWDSEGIWHDEGFEYIENEENNTFTTNNMLNDMHLPDLKLSGFRNWFKPKQVRGKWYWLGTQIQIWMKDSIHPNSDKSWQCRNIYAKTLAQFINSFGDNSKI